MKAAFHFDADHERFDRYYGLPVVKEIFGILSQKETPSLHLKIFSGNICSIDYLKNRKSREELLQGLIRPPRPVWQSLRPDFVDYLFNRTIFVLAFEGISARLRDSLHEALLNDETYLGAQQVHEANPVHWVLYGASLIPSYRIVGSDLRLFYSVGQGDEKDESLADDLKAYIPFSSVTFEELEVQHTILDSYSSYEHASRIANLSTKLYDHLNLVSDQLMLKLTDLAPELYEDMHATLASFEDVETPEDLPGAAHSGIKMLQSLADRISSPGDSPEGTVQQADFQESLTRYISGQLTDSGVLLSQLKDLSDRSYKILGGANSKTSEADPRLEAGRLLIGLIVFINDIVSIPREH